MGLHVNKCIHGIDRHKEDQGKIELHADIINKLCLKRQTYSLHSHALGMIQHVNMQYIHNHCQF